MLEQGYLQLIPWDHVHMAFECFQGCGLHSLSGQPVLSHPDNEKVFPDVQREPPVFQLLPVGFCHWSLLKRAWLHPPCTLPSDVCIYTHTFL